LKQETRARWAEYWGLREEFTLVRFAYAFTAHRSQGSSIQTTYVDVRDILANPEPEERLQCLLVATTRAREKLVTLL
jgi:ATP-dependent exoDNAse (exonuclease V) alpha subunit